MIHTLTPPIHLPIPAALPQVAAGAEGFADLFATEAALPSPEGGAVATIPTAPPIILPQLEGAAVDPRLPKADTPAPEMDLQSAADPDAVPPDGVQPDGVQPDGVQPDGVQPDTPPALPTPAQQIVWSRAEWPLADMPSPSPADTTLAADDARTERLVPDAGPTVAFGPGAIPVTLPPAPPAQTITPPAPDAAKPESPPATAAAGAIPATDLQISPSEPPGPGVVVPDTPPPDAAPAAAPPAAPSVPVPQTPAPQTDLPAPDRPTAPAPAPTPDPVAHTTLERLADLAPDDDLGPLQVTVERDGEQIRIVLTAERAETLDLMRRHADQLLADLAREGLGNATFAFAQAETGGEADAEGDAPAPDATHIDITTHRTTSGLDLRL
ncbi:flagellar hook-length control protein FliK [Falsirhodobacter halotolerans]|uniref:flagellar hook-length control protein FliK n=1 Tax=Falsirhodobacter halotolerans TaxID=1146892 RepID=UPI001FCFE030|nr:flagellar hook-length control protein FliK [Falsirhodobacter halotolerans]MCJ8140573.1 flagellar hook-length control protein FliK [Falsirhodobacter halotolerans]